jgi:hypothetical protein
MCHYFEVLFEVRRGCRVQRRLILFHHDLFDDFLPAPQRVVRLQSSGDGIDESSFGYGGTLKMNLRAERRILCEQPTPSSARICAARASAHVALSCQYALTVASP